MSTCEVDGCDKPARTKGMCRNHYQQAWRRNREKESPPCKVAECDGSVYAKGYCYRHYTRVRRHGDPGPAERLRAPKGEKPACKVEGCETLHNSHGYCTHHARKYYYPPREERCTVEGCARPFHAKGYCFAHYWAAWNGHGQPERAVDKRCRCVLCARYRAEHPEDWARAQHVWHERQRRRRRALEQFTPAMKTAVTRVLQAGRADSATISAAASAAGITVTRLWVYVELLPRWGRQLDAILAETRDPDLKHGTEWAYKKGRCRCPECRECNRLRSQRERASRTDLTKD